MAQNNLFLLVSMVMVCLAPGIHGTSHLMFANSSGQQVNITRDGCGMTNVCVDQVLNCNPSVTGSCLFASIELASMAAPNGSVLNIMLQGTAAANQYIAIGLQPFVGPTLVFICGRVNETFRFFTRDLNISTAVLTPSETRVKKILANIMGDLLKCQFTVPNVNATQTRSADTTFNVQLATGTIGSDGDPDELNVRQNATAVNFADPTSGVLRTTAAPATTGTPTGTTSRSGPTSFISPASLLLWSVLAWSALLKM